MSIKQQGGVFGRNPTFNDVDAKSITTDKVSATADGSAPLELNRLTSDGDIAVFEKNGIKTGSIGTYSGLLTVGHADVGVVFSEGGDSILPINMTTNTLRDNAINLGDATRRFKDIHLSGNVIVASGKGIDFSATSGTGTSELFDDYEEGTWTPTLKALTTDFDSVTYDAIRAASYTKIGRVVQIQLTMRTDAITVGSASGLLGIGGLPFTPVAGNVGASSLSVSVGSTFASNTPIAAEVSGGVSDIYLLYRSSVSGNTAYCQAADAGTGANANFVRVSGTYTTA